MSDDVRWTKQAACEDAETDWFFATGASPESRAAKRICRSCNVREECLEFALENDMYGIWGGLDDRERAALQRHRERQTS